MTEPIESAEQFAERLSGDCSSTGLDGCLNFHEAEAVPLITTRDTAIHSSAFAAGVAAGKVELLGEMLQLADAFVLGDGDPYEKAWGMLNDKYASRAKEEL